VLQCVAVCCSAILDLTVPSLSVIECVAVRYSVL